ncbi:MAG: hypothetical protein RL199_665 [Pseudomonadota bacterium]|jgi:hypothetical protein
MKQTFPSASLVALLVLSALPGRARAEVDTFWLGSGRDGDVVFSADAVPNQVATRVTRDAAARASTVFVDSSAGFAADQLVMLHVTQGVTSDEARAAAVPLDLGRWSTGRWELARIASTTPSSVTFTNALTNPFPGGATQLLVVREYGRVTVNAGVSVRAPPWNPDTGTGGILAFLATGAVVSNGKLSADGAGLRGGIVASDPSGVSACADPDEASPFGGGKGEGLVSGSAGAFAGPGALGNGGGGGNCVRAGGGGGGHGGAGGQGGFSSSGDGSRDVGGRGGAAVVASAVDRLVFGAGGGAGHATGAGGSDGGAGGGVVFVRAASHSGSGVASADGASIVRSGGADGSGGGGAGGTVVLRFIGAADCGGASAAGGAGGSGGADAGPGGGGGGGHVLLQSSAGSCRLAVRVSGGASGTASGAARGARAGGVGTFDGLSFGLVDPNTLVTDAAPLVITSPGAKSWTRERVVSFSGSAPGSRTVVLSVDGVDAGRVGSSAAGAWNWKGPSLADGTYAVAAMVDVDGLRSLPSTPVTVVVDNVAPPSPGVDAPADGAYLRTRTPALSGRCSPDTVTVKLVVDALPEQSARCASGAWSVTAASLVEGAHVLSARSVDPAGNPSAATTVGFVVDLTAPAADFARTPPNPSNVVRPVFEFTTSNDEPVVREWWCKLDTAAYAKCSNPWSPSGALAAGNHTLAVYAIDAAGNNGVAKAKSYAWAVDLTPPRAPSLTTSPTSVASTANAVVGAPGNVTFTFSSDNGSIYACTVDDGDPATCTSPLTVKGAEGAHAFLVVAIDAAGNRSAPTGPKTWVVDTTAPVVSFAPGLPARTKAASLSVGFTANETATFQCALDAAALATCSSPKSLSSLTAGAHTFKVKATDTAKNAGDTATYTFVVDRTAPDTVISSGPVSPTNSAAFVFATADGLSATFQCKLDQAAVFSACPADGRFINLTGGSHSLQVKAVDEAGNEDASPATWSWSMDVTPPDVRFTGTVPSGATRTTSASFDFASSDATATFECALDGAAFAACSSPRFLASLPDAAHRFEVRAKDPAGNVSSPAAAATWTVDTTAPATRFTQKPANPTNVVTATFALAAEEETTFACRLDGEGTFGGCGPFGPLAAGAHFLEVQGTDAVGNVESPPASYGWVIDLTPPTTTVPAAPTSLSNLVTATFRFASNEAGSTFSCALDDAAPTPCDANSAFGPMEDGAHKLVVKATDAAGNTDPAGVTTRWTVDTRAPDTSLSTKPDAATPSDAAAFTFRTDDASPGVTFQCRLDDADFAACNSPKAYSGLAVDRTHRFFVRAVDAAGNADATPAEWSWAIDRTAPETSLDTGPGDTTALTTGSFQFSSPEPGSAFECSLDGAAYASCVPPVVVGPLAEGRHTFSVRARDAAGNVDATPALWRWGIDLTRPETRLVSGPAARTASPEATMVLESTEPGSRLECALDGAPYEACPVDGRITGLADGGHEFNARAVDTAGNVDATPAVARWVVDTRLVLGPATVVGPGRVTFAFAASEEVTYECRLDAEVFGACPTPFTVESPAVGSHAFEVRAVDLVRNGDPTPARRTFRVQGVPPSDADADGLPDVDERALGLDPQSADTDGDGLGDLVELSVTRTDPQDDDTDDDGLVDGHEDLDDDGVVDPGETNPRRFDTDGDGLGDGLERGRAAPEGTGTGSAFVPDADPSTTTEPVRADTDGGGVLDGLEDADRDGRVSDGESDPRARDDDSGDADSDGASDAFETTNGTSPTDDDSDDDGVTDAADGYGDADGDGLVDALDADADGDGLADGLELGLRTPMGTGTERARGRFFPDADAGSTTDPRDDDTDDDGLMDGTEDADHDGRRAAAETDPADPDTDRDGLWDGLERGLGAAAGRHTAARFQPDADPFSRTDPLAADTDGGGVHDGFEDLDHDGRVDLGESDPARKDDDHDADQDGLSDEQELAAGLDPHDADCDDDGVTDAADGLVDTDVDQFIDALDPDSDGDGLLDGTEAGVTGATVGPATAPGSTGFRPDVEPASNTDPKRPDTDGDGLSDGAEDLDRDGRRAPEETDPTLADTDKDGLSDALERSADNPTDPVAADSDGDGLADGAEDADKNGRVNGRETNPVLADSDGGGVPDGSEGRLRTDPLDPLDDAVLASAGCASADPSLGALGALAVWLARVAGRRRERRRRDVIR